MDVFREHAIYWVKLVQMLHWDDQPIDGKGAAPIRQWDAVPVVTGSSSSAAGGGPTYGEGPFVDASRARPEFFVKG
eukprot:9106442-Prorocentrum_lima.AAC.1